MFDYNNSPRGGADFNVDGDLTIKEDYYPWINEAFIGGYVKRISLAGEGGIYLKYRALKARKVHFEPAFHSDFVVRSEEPKVKKFGSFLSFFYPDGSSESDGRASPNFRKLEAIRMAAEGK